MGGQIFEGEALSRSSETSWRLSGVSPPGPCNRVVPSFQVGLAPGDRLRVCVRIQSSSGESLRGELGGWGEPLPAGLPEPDPGLRREVDELVLEGGQVLSVDLEFQVEDPKSNLLRAAVAFWPSFEEIELPPGSCLPSSKVPRICQYASGHPEGGRICGPASLTMGLQGLGVSAELLRECEEVWDPYFGIYGNWARLAARAGDHGIRAWVERGGGPRALGAHLAARRLVLLSLAWDGHERPNPPIPRSSGHLVLAVGFDSEGVWIQDPAYSPEHPDRSHLDWQGLLRSWKSGASIVLEKASVRS